MDQLKLNNIQKWLWKAPDYIPAADRRIYEARAVVPLVGAWDIAAIKPIIEAAGGIFTDFHGKKTIYGGTAVASNTSIHNSLLRLIDGKPNSGR